MFHLIHQMKGEFAYIMCDEGVNLCSEIEEVIKSITGRRSPASLGAKINELEEITVDLANEVSQLVDMQDFLKAA